MTTTPEEDYRAEPVGDCIKCGEPCTVGKYQDQEWGMCEYCCSIICPACIDEMWDEAGGDYPPCPACGLDCNGETLAGVPIDEDTRRMWQDFISHYIL